MRLLCGTVYTESFKQKEENPVGGTAAAPCILISSREQQNAEQEYYRNTLGFGGSYLFADNLEEARLLVVSGRGFLPVESVGTLPPEGNSIRRLPVYQGDQQIMRNYCMFWKKDQTGYYIEEFADLLRRLLFA